MIHCGPKLDTGMPWVERETEVFTERDWEYLNNMTASRHLFRSPRDVRLDSSRVTGCFLFGHFGHQVYRLLFLRGKGAEVGGVVTEEGGGTGRRLYVSIFQHFSKWNSFLFWPNLAYRSLFPQPLPPLLHRPPPPPPPHPVSSQSPPPPSTSTSAMDNAYFATRLDALSSHAKFPQHGPVIRQNTPTRKSILEATMIFCLVYLQPEPDVPLKSRARLGRQEIAASLGPGRHTILHALSVDRGPERLVPRRHWLRGRCVLIKCWNAASQLSVKFSPRSIQGT